MIRLIHYLQYGAEVMLSCLNDIFVFGLNLLPSPFYSYWVKSGLKFKSVRCWRGTDPCWSCEGICVERTRRTPKTTRVLLTFRTLPGKWLKGARGFCSDLLLASALSMSPCLSGRLCQRLSLPSVLVHVQSWCCSVKCSIHSKINVSFGECKWQKLNLTVTVLADVTSPSLCSHVQTPLLIFYIFSLLQMLNVTGRDLFALFRLQTPNLGWWRPGGRATAAEEAMNGTRRFN